MTVWVLTISHKYGVDTVVFRTFESAHADLVKFVTEWWDERKDYPMPDDKDMAIEEYFWDHPYEYYDLNESYLND